MIELPDGLLAQARLGPDWAAWLDDLPRRAGSVVRDWGLSLDGPATHGYCSLVLPVRTAAGGPAVLKLHVPDEESEHEHLALRHWGGDGAVRLLRADPTRWALLLERLSATDLGAVPALDACEIVANLYPRLHRPAFPQLRPLTAYADRWLAALRTLPRGAPIPRRLVEQALSAGADLVADPASTGVVVHGDLHFANVLAGEREPWLVIDPKPMSGDPHYEPAPLLWNRWEELVATGDLRGGLRRRFETVVDVAGLDEDRAVAWVVVRMVLNAHWTIQDAHRAGGGLGAGDREWITRCIAMVKAVQP